MKNWNSTRDFLLSIPQPQKTETYSPVPHGTFINTIQECLSEKGYNISGERYLTANNGQIMTGLFTLGNTDFFGVSPSIQFVNSYNKTRRASVRASGVVLVCKNGMMGATEHGFYQKKHTGTILEDLRSNIATVVTGIEIEFERIKTNVTEMKETKLSNRVISELVGDMFLNEALIGATQLGILKNELRYSKDFNDGSLWSFYNNVTEAFKNNHPFLYDKQHVKFHTYITDKFGLSGSRGLYGDAIYQNGSEAEVLSFENVFNTPEQNDYTVEFN